MLRTCLSRCFTGSLCRITLRTPDSSIFAPLVAQRNASDVVPLRKQLKDAKKARRLRDESSKFETDDGLKERRLARWQLTVGIEIHAQLNSAHKLFSPASTAYSETPNTTIDPFDLAVPGSQPVLQLQPIIPAVRAALALGCTVQPRSSFDRKHYFYHDQPAGYQITQYYSPFARDGRITLTARDGLSQDEESVVVGIKQIQLEQDTARTQDQDAETSLIDYNRSGCALIEIISLPHIHSAAAAAAYVRKVQGILYAVDAVTTGMELGGLRADVNVSVRRREPAANKFEEHAVHEYAGVQGLGQRTEIKNLSSPSAVASAVAAEYDRQTASLEANVPVLGETRGWSLSSPNTTRRLRGKEGEVDYRYMPDPDVPPLRISSEVVTYLKNTLPPLPEDLQCMLEQQYHLSVADTEAMLSLDDGTRLLYYQEVVALLFNGSSSRNINKTIKEKDRNRAFDDAEKQKLSIQASNWILHELGALLSTTDTQWTASLIPAQQFADLILLHYLNLITGSSGKRLLKTMFAGDRTEAAAIVLRDKLLFKPMSEEEYTVLLDGIVANHAGEIEVIKAGGRKGEAIFKFLVGQMMRSKEFRGRIDAKKAETRLRERIAD